MIKLSIIIPHKNIPELLYRLVESIPNDDELEIIIIDDNSDLNLIPKKDLLDINRNNIKIIYNKESKGAGYARNIGLKNAQGQWILFADADDFYLKNVFPLIKTFYDTKYDIVIFNAESKFSDSLQPTNRNDNINKLINLFILNKISSREVALSLHSPWSKLIKKELINNNHIAFDEIPCANDVMFSTKIAVHAKNIGICKEPIYCVTFREGSLWDQRKTDPENYLLRIKVYIERNKYLKVNKISTTPILGSILKASKFSLRVFFKALYFGLKSNQLFTGCSKYLNTK